MKIEQRADDWRKCGWASGWKRLSERSCQQMGIAFNSA
jgi:hypothetical protein